MKNNILKGFMIYLAIFMLVVPVARYFAHREAPKLWQQEQKKKLHVVNGQTISTDVHISGTDRSIKHNVGRNSIEASAKRVMFVDECKKTDSIVGTADNTVRAHLRRAILLYSYKFMVVSYCNEKDMAGYVKNFDTTFAPLYNTSLDMLNNLTDSNVEKCIVVPAVVARTKYLHKEIGALFNDAKFGWELASDYTTSLDKLEFCNMLNTDKELQKILFDKCKEDIAIGNNSSFPVLSK